MAMLTGIASAGRPGSPHRRLVLAAGPLAALLVAGLLAPAATLAAPPATGMDSFTTAEDTATSGNVLLNDSDTDGDPLIVSSFVGPNLAYGTMTMAANGDFTYTPAANFTGTINPIYFASDGTSSVLGYIEITVTPVNDDPVAVDDMASGTEDEDLVIAGSTLTGNDTDVDGDALTVTAVGDATGGTVELAAGDVTFTPTADLCGTAVGGFDYTLEDEGAVSDSAHVTVDLDCVNDAPVAVDDTASVDQGSAAADHDVLANDTDVDSASLTLDSADVAAAAGTASVVGNKVRFAPLKAFNGEAVVTYVVSDGVLDDTGTLTIQVGPDVTAPTVAVPGVAFGSGRVNESAPIAISWSATDAGAGVASYDVEVNVGGTGFVPLYSGSATSATRFYAFNKTLVFRVRATDGEDNVSGWVESATRKVVPYQAPGSSAITYRRAWTSVNATSASGDRYRYSTVLGAKAKLTFTGRAVLYVAPRNARSGKVRVYVDGLLLGRYNLRSDVTRNGSIIARKTWAVSASHRIRIVNDSSGRRANLDVFLVLK